MYLLMLQLLTQKAVLRGFKAVQGVFVGLFIIAAVGHCLSLRKYKKVYPQRARQSFSP